MREKFKLVFSSAARGILICLFLVAGTGCTKKVDGNFEVNPRVPAAKGAFESSVGENGNTKLTIKVEHLAAASAVDPRATTYVVWAKDALTNNVANLGALRLSSELEGKIETLTSFKKFETFITPEATANSEKPAGEKLLWALVDHQAP